MLCLNQKCMTRNKNAGEACTIAGECASNLCHNNRCAALAIGSSCATTKLCGSPDNLLFCNTNNTCAATVDEGHTCSLPNGDFMQCKPGLYCTKSLTSGICRAPAREGATCSLSAGFDRMYSAPGCSNKDFTQSCLNDKCVAHFTIPQGGRCGAGVQGGVCDSRVSTCLNGVCTLYRDIPCQSSSSCGGGMCVCSSSDKYSDGTCEASPYNGFSCHPFYAQMSECIYTANTQNAISVCASKIRAYKCCLKQSFKLVYNDSDLDCDSDSPNTLAIVLGVFGSAFGILIIAAIAVGVGYGVHVHKMRAKQRQDFERL